MADLFNNAEGETTGAALVSGGGGASGNPVDTVTIAGAGAITVSTTHPAHGVKSYYFFCNGGSDLARAFWSWTAADSASMEFYDYFATLPSQAQRFASFINTAFSQCANLQFNASNALVMVDTGGTAHTFAVLSAATMYRFESGITIGTTTANGSWQAGYALGDSASYVDSFSTGAVRNVGTAQIIEGQVGSNTAGSKFDMYVDGIWFGPGRNVLLGVPAPSIPVATIEARPAPQLHGTVTVTGNVSCTSGTVKTANVLIVSGPDNPTVTQGRSGLNIPSCDLTSTFTGAAGRYVVKVTGTNDLDQTVTTEPTQIIDVYPDPDVTVKPYSELTGTDAIYGGSATKIAAVTDSNSATGIQGATGPSLETETFQWCSFGPGDITFWLMHDQTPTTPAINVEVTVFKEDGTTQLHQETVTAPTTLGTESPIVLSPSEMTVLSAADLTDRRALITRTKATST